MTRWQYLTVHPGEHYDEQQRGYLYGTSYLGPNVDDLYNRLGDDGWELVAVHFASAPRNVGGVRYTDRDSLIFKRPKP